MESRKFHIATESEIKNAETTDVYFQRTREILEAEGLADVKVVAEITTSSFPKSWEWGLFAGLEEAAHLLENIHVTMKSIPEGSIFHTNDVNGVRLPVMVLEGRYVDFCLYETPLLGLLCHASGIATMAARVRQAAGTKTLMSFGIRRAHPVLAPMIDRACYIAGFDTVSSLIGAKLLGKKPTGTMPHSLIVTIGNQKHAWLAFDKHTPADVPRIMLVDTYCDEKTESIMAAETLGKKLAGVRLDTPASRRGNILDILREVRWELDARGFDHVKIFVSGGLDEDKVRLMADAGADGFGVGTSVSNAPSIDFAMDIVEADGKLVAKRGKLGGEKKVWRCNNCILEQVTLANVENIPSCPKCGRPMHEFMETIVKNGILAKKLLSVDNIHDYVMKQLQIMTVSS